MIHYSVIIPQRDRGDDIRRQLPPLVAAISQLARPYEIIVVDDASQPATLRLLDKLLTECHALRLLRLDAPAGASLALAVGVKAARGEVLIATAPGDCYPATQIPWLVGWLRRADLVVGRRQQFGLAKLRQRMARIPRWLLLGLESHDPGCLFWAARREVFADLNLLPGIGRYLPALVARRGYRVCEAYVQHRGERQRLPDLQPKFGDLLAAWWICRRWREHNAVERLPGAVAHGALRLVGADEAAPASAASAGGYPPESPATTLNPAATSVPFPPQARSA